MYFKFSIANSVVVTSALISKKKNFNSVIIDILLYIIETRFKSYLYYLFINMIYTYSYNLKISLKGLIYVNCYLLNFERK